MRGRRGADIFMFHDNTVWGNMPKQHRRGRPPKPPEEKQSVRVMAALTPGEYAALAKAAGTKPIGGYVRRVLLGHLRRRAKV